MIYVALLVLMGCLTIGVPVPVSFMASAAWLIFFGGPDGMGYEASQLLPYGFTQMNSVSLIAIAMFIMAGGIMERGKIGEKLMRIRSRLLSQISTSVLRNIRGRYPHSA